MGNNPVSTMFSYEILNDGKYHTVQLLSVMKVGEQRSLSLCRNDEKIPVNIPEIFSNTLLLPAFSKQTFLPRLNFDTQRRRETVEINSFCFIVYKSV